MMKSPPNFKDTKEFQLSSLKKAARFRDYEDALFWLADAMIINNCFNSTAPSIGLKLNMERQTSLLLEHGNLLMN